MSHTHKRGPRSPIATTCRAIAVSIAMIAASLPSNAETFRTFGATDDAIQFVSAAPLERIVGKAAELTATADISDVTNLLTTPIVACAEVDLATIDTGNGLRNKHMREQYLEVEEFPKARFTLTELKSAHTFNPDHPEAKGAPVQGLNINQPTRVSAIGTFTIHGVEREIELTDLLLTYEQDPDRQESAPDRHLLKISGTFNIELADYDIERPQLLLMRLAKEVTVNVDLVMRTSEPDQSKPCGDSADSDVLDN